MSKKATATSDPRLVERVLGEYREMPGPALTIEQACRLWNCDERTVRRIADVLVSARVLHWSQDGKLIGR